MHTEYIFNDCHKVDSLLNSAWVSKNGASVILVWKYINIIIQLLYIALQCNALPATVQNAFRTTLHNLPVISNFFSISGHSYIDIHLWTFNWLLKAIAVMNSVSMKLIFCKTTTNPLHFDPYGEGPVHKCAYSWALLIANKAHNLQRLPFKA